jgi:hypothetical protein
MSISIGNTNSNNALTAVSSGQITLTTGVADEIILVFVHNEISTNTPGALPTPSVSDDRGLTWHEIKSQEWADTPDTPDSQNRMAVFWAHEPTAQSHTITVDFGGTVDDATLGAIGVRDANVSDPLDSNAAALKFSTWIASQAPQVDDLSTDANIAVVVFFYGSPINTAIGSLTGFNQRISSTNAGGTNWSKQDVWTKTIATAEVAADYDFSGSTTVGGVIAFVIRDESESDPAGPGGGSAPGIQAIECGLIGGTDDPGLHAIEQGIIG